MLRTVRKIFGNIINKVAQASVNEINDGLDSSEQMKALCRKAAAESCVLLKNNQVLPLGGKRVSVFGRCQVNYFYVGYGSGGDVKAPYRISLLKGLRESDIIVNEDLASEYEAWCKKNPPYDGFWGHWPTYYDEMPIASSRIERASKETDVAIVVIGRSAGEDRENKLIRGSWYLTKAEERLLQTVSTHFQKVCVVLNCGAIMDMSWVEKYRIGAVLYSWQGGQESGNGVADVLSGKVSPCGKLPCTIANIDDYLSAESFGNKKNTEYTEDIYVGYRAFETFDYLKEKTIYPFGFGLSYTQFSIEQGGVDIADKISVRATVKNIGKCSGKEVLQLYLSAPEGKLGKPEKVLVAYKKTRELAPDEEETLTLTFEINDFASYDDSGATGHKNCYILEGGEYRLYLGNSVKNVTLCNTFDLEERVVNRTKSVCAPDEPFKRIINDHGKVKLENTLEKTNDLKERILNNLPDEIAYTGDRGYKLSDVVEGKISLDEFISQLSLDELETLTRGSLEGMNCSLGAPGNAAVFCGTSQSLQEKGILPMCTNDGPSGVRLQAHSSLIPIGTALACTFDNELIYDLAFGLGKETVERGSHALLAPGINIHRNPLCGRNFEYFSEDPVLSGNLGAAYVSGVQAAGASAVPKHFACNNQETNRLHNNSRVSQRALREIYLRNFEICIKKSNPHLIMASYNKLNGVLNCYNYDLCTEILRNEWGYDGCVMTDWWMVNDKSPDFKNLENQAYRVRAQVDVFMPGASRFGRYRGKSDGSIQASCGKADGITHAELQRTAKNVLQYCLKMKY